MKGNRYIHRACAAAAVLLFFTAGCAMSKRQDTQRDARKGSIVISWEFTTIEKNGSPYTDTVMVVNGGRTGKYPLGLFYGKVNKVHTSTDHIKEMEGGALSGFITGNAGDGYEVVVRYDENLNRLYVVFREIDGGNYPGNFKALKNIFLPRGNRLDTGF